MNNANYFPFERNRYFYGKLLTVRDFEVEQRYHCTKRALLNRLVHGAGVVCGLGVTASDESTLMIESGMALDYRAGRSWCLRPCSASCRCWKGRRRWPESRTPTCA